VLGDARLSLAAIGSALAGLGPDDAAWRERADAIALEKEKYEVDVADACRTDAVPLASRRIVREMNEVFGPDAILVNENGSQDLWSYSHPFYRVGAIGGCVPPGEQTCMGFATGAAIGAKLAAPHRDVVCETGDGAFQMFVEEMPTAKQSGAPITWVVLNGFSLGWPRFGQKLLRGRYIATEYTVQPDFAAVARASGCHGERIAQPVEIRPALRRAKRANAEGLPAVLDFLIDQEDLSYGFLSYYRRTGR
jgi:acetolactate synthase-1/2/3 large subunit